MEEYGYEVGKVIGNGSYGTVYEAYYTKQKVHVAVKIISKKKASEDYLNKFLPREIQVGMGEGGKSLEGSGCWGLHQDGLGDPELLPKTGLNLVQDPFKHSH